VEIPAPFPVTNASSGSVTQPFPSNKPQVSFQNPAVNTTQAPAIDKSVMDLSPSLYAAAMTSGFNPAQANMLNQIAGTVQTYKGLNALPLQQAKTNYKALSDESKSMIEAMYGRPEWTNTDNFVTQLFKGTIKHVAEAAASPILAMYKLVGGEGKAINAPYMYSRELSQGESAFNLKTYQGAWNGNAVFDKGNLSALTQKYGDANSFVAQQVLMGKTPGQIIDDYGKVTPELYTALANMLGNTKDFSSMLDEFRGAQVSPGRDIGRIMMNVPMTDSHTYTTAKWKNTTGTIDAFYEILHDPLTWLSGGLSKGAEASSKGAQLAEKLLTDPETRAGNVEKMFAQGSTLSNNWDNIYGPLIKRVADADAAKNPQAKASVMKDIEQQAPGINNRGLLNILTQAKVFDANGAKAFAKTMQGAQELHMGLVDGPTFLRMGIPGARRQRQVLSAGNKILGDLFNGDATPELVDNIGKLGSGHLQAIGRHIDDLTGKPGIASTPLLDELQNQVKTVGNRVTRMLQTHPGHDVINVMDHNVDETLPVVRRYLRLIYPRWAAEPMAEAFKYSNPADRVNYVRGLYTQIMQAMQVPEDKIQAVLESKFADTTTFINGKDLIVPEEYVSQIKSPDILTHQEDTDKGALFRTTTNGPIHSFQSRPNIGGLDWTGPELAPYGFNFAKSKPVHILQDVAGYGIRSKFARAITNLWASGSIFPRMGVRGSIEQGIFHYLTAPWDNITRWSMGRKANMATIAFTGNEKQIPFGSRVLRDAFGINPAKWIEEKSTYDQANQKIMQGHFDKGFINGKEAWEAAAPNDVIKALSDKIDKLSGKDPEVAAVFKKFMKYPTASKSAEVNSVLSRSAMYQGVAGSELDQPLLSSKGIEKMLKELKYEATGDLKLISPKEVAKVFGDQALSAAHFRAWEPMFKQWNKLDGFHFGENFIRNNALRTGKDFANARDTILKYFGVNPETGKIFNQTQFDKFANQSMQVARDVMDKGWTPVQSVINRIEHGLLDMRQTFHGNPLDFNDRLFGAIKDAADEAIAEGAKPGVAIRKAIDKIQYDNFEELTRGFRPVQDFKSDLSFANKQEWNTDNIINAMKNFGNGSIQHNALGLMDGQINWLFNQPAFRVAAVNLNMKYAPLEREMVARLISNGTSREVAIRLAEEHFINLAESNAAATVIKFVDNAARQSNLSFAVRTTGRFYRAQEQYMRRIWRLKDYSIRSLSRMRLLHLGIQNLGFIHQDNQGQPYFTMPGDNILFHAVNGALSFASGNRDAVSQPLFTDFNMKLIQSSPSLGLDAGRPSFSGPLMSIPILGLKKMFSMLPWAKSKEASTRIDSFLLGPNSGNLSASKLLPTFAQRAIELLPKNEQDQQLASAAMMAISYNAMHGYGLTPEQIRGMSSADYATKASKYLNDIHVTANNVIGLRALVGMISPISPTMVEDKDVSSYMKDLGFSSLNSEFADLLQGVMRNDKGLVDPYEIALGIFTDQHPGRSIFAIGKNDKNAQLLQTYTQTAQDWIMTHSKWTNNSDPNISQASMIFVPNVNKFDPSAYVAMEAYGLLKQKNLSDYLQQVLTAQDVAAYHNAKYRADILLQDPTANRAQVIANMQGEQDAIKSSPVVAAQLEDSVGATAKAQGMMAGLGALLQDKTFPIASGDRAKMLTTWNLVNQAVTSLSADTTKNGYISDPLDKETRKQQVLNAVAAIGGADKEGDAPTDPQIAEALRAIYVPLLDSVSRTTLKAGLTK
jgi:hypothetical protein